MSDQDLNQREKERNVFYTFLAAYPTLKESVKQVCSPLSANDFPDITVKFRDGSELDFELGEWLECLQMGGAKRSEQIRSFILDAIGKQGPNASGYFSYVMLTLLPNVSCFNNKEDGTTFHSELFALINETDQRWPNEPMWHDPQGFLCTDFGQRSTLAKYLQSIHFPPGSAKKRPSGQRWIVFEETGGAYDPSHAMGALRNIIQRKAGHYGSCIQKKVHLLIHSGQTLLYNTPYHSLDVHSFQDVADAVAKWMSDSSIKPGPFAKIYLLKAVQPNPLAFEVYPDFKLLGP